VTIRTFQVGELCVNAYLVYDDPREAVLIDPGDEANRLLAAVAAEGVCVKAILLTHAHFDHIGAAEAVASATGAPLYLHREEEAALTDPTRNLSGFFGAALTVTGDIRPLRDGDTVTVGGLSFEVLHTPGHTVGGVCYRTGDVLFSGDTLFCESIGRLDFPGGSGEAMRRSLERLLALPASTAVYPGHGEPTSIGHEQQYNPYV